MPDKAEIIKNLIEKSVEFQNNSPSIDKDKIDEWKMEACNVLDENQRIRFAKLNFYQINDDDDLPF